MESTKVSACNARIVVVSIGLSVSKFKCESNERLRGWIQSALEPKAKLDDTLKELNDNEIVPVYVMYVAIHDSLLAKSRTLVALTEQTRNIVRELSKITEISEDDFFVRYSNIKEDCIFLYPDKGDWS